MNFFLYATTVFFWGLSWIAVQFQLGVVAPEVSVAYRFIIAAAVMIPLCVATGRSLKFSLNGHLRMAAQGFFLFGVNFYLVYVGSLNLTSGLVSILFATILIMNTVGGWIWLKAPFEGKAILGSVLGLAGVAVIFWPEFGTSGRSAERAQDVFLVLAGAASAAAGMIMSALNQKHGLPVIRSNAVGMTYGAIFFTVYSLTRGASFEIEISLEYIGSLLFLSLGASVIGFWSFLTLIGRIGPGKASYVMIMMPVVAVTVSSFAEDFTWTPEIAAGIALVLSGNMFILGKDKTAGETVTELPAALGQEKP